MAGVTYVNVDSPVRRTDAGTGSSTTTSSLATLYPLVSGASVAWSEGLTGKGIGVAVLDSGILVSASDLGTRVIQVKLPSQGTSKLDDVVGHGTFVADVLGGQSADGRHVGVAPGATVYAVNVSNSDGSVYTSDIINGLTWVLANKTVSNIRVVNLSLAESIPSSYTTSALDQAVEKLWQAGIVVVVTSGNLGPNRMYYAPGNDPFVITVGASDSSDTQSTSDDYVASFSSYGITGDGFLKPEVVATGRHVVSSLVPGSLLDYQAPAANHVEPGYLMANGTSFAAPQVAGAAALLLQRNPNLTPNQIKWLLTSSGRPVNGSTAPGLDIASALAYSGAPQNANQGIAYSTAPVAAVSSSGGSLNSGSNGDAVSAQRAALKYEASSAWNSAADQWNVAGDAWTKQSRPVSAAIAYDNAGRDYALAGIFDKAANAWISAGTAVVKAGLPEWQPVAIEFAARAWMGAGKYDNAAQTMEQAAAMWAAGFARQSTFDAWNKAALMGIVNLVARRGRLNRGVFDAAQFSLSAGAGAAFFHALGAQDWSASARVLPSVGAAAVYMVVNVGLLSLAISLADGEGQLAVWRERFRWLTPYYLAAGPLALALVVSYEKVGLTGVIAFTLPPAMMMFSTRQYVSHTRRSVEEVRVANEELREANSQLAARNDDLQELFQFAGGLASRAHDRSSLAGFAERELSRLTGGQAELVLGDGEDGIALVAGGARVGCLHLSQTPGFEGERWNRLRDAILPQLSTAIESADLVEQVNKRHLETIAALARSMEAKDYYTGGHTERVSDVAVALARRLGYAGPELDAIEIGALLHDIGKIGIPERILRKPGPLDEEEWKVMREHPLISEYILSEVDLNPIVLQVARSSHERVDGAGYPDGLVGDRIPLPARIVLVADAFDALTSDRPYRAARAVSQALEELRSHAGTQFCAHVVEALEALYREEPQVLGAAALRAVGGAAA